MTYHRLVGETLEELTDFFEDLGERDCTHSDFDASFSVCLSLSTLFLLSLRYSLIFTEWCSNSESWR